MMLKHYFLKFSLFFLCISLWGEEEITLSSDKISFNGDLLLLDGKVKLNHPFAILTSDSARVKKDPNPSHLIFSKALLKQNVHIALKNHGLIRCDLARLDFETLLGDLTSFIDYVEYQERGKKNLCLLARAINFKMTHSTHFDIDYLIATGDAKATLDGLYHLSSRKLSYHKFNPLMKSFSLGVLRAAGDCVFDSSALHIVSDTMSLDLRGPLLEMKEANGAIVSSEQIYSFIAGQLSYDVSSQKISLENNAHLLSENFGYLNAKEKVVIHKNKMGKIDYIKTTGPMTYTYLDHTLSTDGAAHISELVQTLTIENANEIAYKNENFSVFSKRAKIEYSKSIDFVDLEGDVLVLLTDLKRALCDRLYYTPDKRHLKLVANPGSRVYLWNEEGNVSLSTDEVEIWMEDDYKIECTGESKCELK
jgi:hypothetical protein